MILNNEILSLEKMSIFVPAPRETQHSTKCITIPALDEIIVHLKLTPSLPPPTSSVLSGLSYEKTRVNLKFILLTI